MRRLSNALLMSFAVVIGGAASSLHAQPSAYVEGTHYKQVRTIESVEGPIRVTEIFWYGCPHCYSFDPHLESWKQTLPEDVVFERLPTALGRAAGKLQVRAYYTAQVLDVTEAVHHGMFRAIHERGQRLDSEQAIAKVFAEAGVDEAEFSKAYNGFSVSGQTRKAERRVADLGVHTVPTVVVDGRWEVGAAMAGSFPNMLKIIDFLIAKARRERGGD